MIYLIDDKKERQKSFGWNSDMFNNYKDSITRIYSYKEIERIGTANIFNDNIILYHESFFDNPINRHQSNAQKIKQDLIKYSDDKGIIVVFFSGSIGTRIIVHQRATMPVVMLYQNLEFFIKKYNDQESNINHLVYGKEFTKEKFIDAKLEIWNLLYDKKNDKVFENNELLNLKLSTLFSNVNKPNLSNISNRMLKDIIQNLQI